MFLSLLKNSQDIDTNLLESVQYCPNYLVDKDTAGTFVIGRRALGFKENIPENYLGLLSDKDYMLYSIAKLEERKQELNKLNKDMELLYKHLQSLESEPSAQ